MNMLLVGKATGNRLIRSSFTRKNSGVLSLASATLETERALIYFDLDQRKMTNGY